MDNKLKETIYEFIQFYENLNHSQNPTKIGLTKAEVDVIDYVGQNEQVTARQIEKALHIDRGFLSRTIKSLVNKQLIDRLQSEHDKRSFVLKLTKDGDVKRKQIEIEQEQSFTETFKHLSEEEKELFNDALLKVIKIYNKEALNVESVEKKKIDNDIKSFDKEDKVWQTSDGDTLLYKKHDEWMAELILSENLLKEDALNAILKDVISYAYDDYANHLYVNVPKEANYESVLEKHDFFETENQDDHIRYDLFL